MGLLTINNIEDGNPASGNDINSRIGIIVNEINGNLNASNLATNAVTTAKIANGAVTSSKIAVDRYIDANGWSVVDYGTFKQYQKAFTTSGVLNLSEGTRGQIGNTAPPVGRTRDNILLQTTWYGGYSGHVILGCENSGPLNITCQIAHNWPSPLVMNGKAILIATDVL